MVCLNLRYFRLIRPYRYRPGALPGDSILIFPGMLILTLTLEQVIMDAPRSVGRSRFGRRLASGGIEESPHSVERDAG